MHNGSEHMIFHQINQLASTTRSNQHYLLLPNASLWAQTMVKCHVVNVHMTPLEERQHTSHQNIERIPNSHDYL